MPVRVPFVNRWYPYLESGKVDKFQDELEFGIGLGYSTGVLNKKWKLADTPRRKLSQLKYFVGRRAAMPPIALVKDPNASLLLKTLSRWKEAQSVIIIRHPAAFYASLKRMNWKISPKTLFLYPDELKVMLPDWIIGHLNDEPDSPVKQSAIHWAALNAILLQFSMELPNTIVCRHEDLSQNPVDQYRELFQKLDLSFTGKTREAIEELCGTGNPTDPVEGAIHTLKRNSASNIWRWKEFISPDELSQIQDITGSLGRKLYPEDDFWSL